MRSANTGFHKNTKFAVSTGTADSGRGIYGALYSVQVADSNFFRTSNLANADFAIVIGANMAVFGLVNAALSVTDRFSLISTSDLASLSPVQIKSTR